MEFEFRCVEKIGNSIVLLTKNTCDLFVYDIAKGDLCYVSRIAVGEELYLSSAVVNGMVVFLPYYGERVCIYDVSRNEISYEEFKPSDVENNKPKCGVNYVDGHNIYVVAGKGCSIVIKYSIDSQKVECFKGWIDELGDSGSNMLINTYANISYYKQSIWFTLDCPDTVLEFRTIDNSYKVWHLPSRGIRYNSICSLDDDKYLMLGDEMSIILWDKEHNSIDAIEIPQDKCGIAKKKCPWKGLFFSSIRIGQLVFLSPLHSNSFILLNISSNELRAIEVLNQDEFCFVFKLFEDDSIYAEVDSWINSEVVTKRRIIINDMSARELSLTKRRIDFYSRGILDRDSYGRLIQEEYSGYFDWWLSQI